MKLWEKLRLDPDRCRVAALVGAGGKTSTLFALAHEARARGLTAIVTTTTHIRPHPRLPLTGETDGEKLRALVDAQGVVLCGRMEATGKLTLAAAADTCRQAADVVLVEADGAKMLPLKAPAEHEPVIPLCADAVVAVAGLDGVGQAVEAACHRPERVRALLGAGEARRFFTILLPLCRHSLAGALVLVWSRALGEFGATLMLVGVTRMKTETLPANIYLNVAPTI